MHVPVKLAYTSTEVPHLSFTPLSPAMVVKTSCKLAKWDRGGGKAPAEIDSCLTYFIHTKNALHETGFSEPAPLLTPLPENDCMAEIWNDVITDHYQSPYSLRTR